MERGQPRSRAELGVVALIPARGGSKSIPRKNIALVAGKPLIVWTIEAARRSPSLDRVVVSTDDRKIAEVAAGCGAEVPFIRPENLAGDETPSLDVVIHAIEWMERNERHMPETIVLLQPTSPLRTAGDIEAAVRLARDRKADSVVSVCDAHEHPLWAKSVSEDGVLLDYLPGRKAGRRQDLSPVYALNGAIYLARTQVLLNRRTFYTDRTYAYIMPRERSLDIDTPWDLQLAELILRHVHVPD